MLGAVWLGQRLADGQKHLHSGIIALLPRIGLFLKNKQSPLLSVCLLRPTGDLAMNKMLLGSTCDVLKFWPPPSNGAVHCN